jgi:hypothetical protein
MIYALSHNDLGGEVGDHGRDPVGG